MKLPIHFNLKWYYIDVIKLTSNQSIDKKDNNDDHGKRIITYLKFNTNDTNDKTNNDNNNFLFNDQMKKIKIDKNVVNLLNLITIEDAIDYCGLNPPSNLNSTLLLTWCLILPNLSEFEYKKIENIDSYINSISGFGYININNNEINYLYL